MVSYQQLDVHELIVQSFAFDIVTFHETWLVLNSQHLLGFKIHWSEPFLPQNQLHTTKKMCAFGEIKSHMVQRHQAKQLLKLTSQHASKPTRPSRATHQFVRQCD